MTFYAHASFRLTTPELGVISDPYTPGASGSGPIDEPADLVITSLATDRFHPDPSHVRGQLTKINALLDPPAEIHRSGSGLRRACVFREVRRPQATLCGDLAALGLLHDFTSLSLLFIRQYLVSSGWVG